METLRDKVGAEPNKYSKWICAGVDGLEITLKVRVNFQYDKEEEDIVNFQVFAQTDKREEMDLYEHVSIDDIEALRCAIFEAVKEYENG